MIAATADYGIPLAVLVISVVTLIGTQIAQTRAMLRSSSIDYMKELEDRVEDCERRREELRLQLKQAQEENISLMRRVMQLENGKR